MCTCEEPELRHDKMDPKRRGHKKKSQDQVKMSVGGASRFDLVREYPIYDEVHRTPGVPCSPPHLAPPSLSLPGYRDPYGGSGGSYTSQRDALLLGATAIDSVSAVPTNLSAQTYAERVEEYHQRYAYMKSWAGLLRILGCVQLLFDAAVFACVCAYVHKDNQWFNMYGYSTPQLYGGLGGGAYGAGGAMYTGPKTPFVLVVAALAWVVTAILVVLDMSLYYRAILLDSPWWPLMQCTVNAALAMLYFAAAIIYVRDTTRGGLCNLPVFNNDLNSAFCRTEPGQNAAIVFLFINTVLYLISAAVCLKLWRHEAARLRRQAYEQESSGPESSATKRDYSDSDTSERCTVPHHTPEDMEDKMEKGQKQSSVMELLRRLHLQDRWENKLTSAEFLQIKQTLKPDQDLQERDLCSVYLHKLLMLDYRARYTQATQENTNTTHVCEQNEADDFFEDSEDISEQTNIHPLDLQMAVFHCSDSFLKQKMLTKLSQCQYALPLLVPDPFTGDTEFPLWTFRQIQKTWKKTETIKNENVVTMKSMSICKAQTPMVLCFRLGSLSVSKSQLINPLINDRHSTFFHRHCPGSTESRLLFNGVAEIAWYCPAGKPNDSFNDCVAFCNLHGDGLTYNKQLETLMDKSSINLVFVPTLDRKHKSAAVIECLLESETHLIVLVENSGNNATQLEGKNTVGLKYKVGLKGRSQSDVSEELKRTIRNILSASHKSIQLESMSLTGLRVDEHDTKGCTKGLSSAEDFMKIIEPVPVSEVTKKLLPCQGQLWHDWSRINKERYHLTGNVEREKSEKLNVCRKLREDQCKASGGELIKSFITHLSSLCPTEREYFLKWTQIRLDDYATNQLSLILQNYNQKWTEVLDLKKSPDRSHELKLKQEELKKISQELQSATCGLEHIFREMGQIYEAHQSLDKPPGLGPTDWSKYPELAAEMMISGHPMELMDGDAGHVPLTWIKSLIDQVIVKLGDKTRVFVLSVLGIQSSGKSTMLNAMFGLQFAVSAGRCTRGVFMQLLKLSEDMKKDLSWDYILVVDTEGLRAQELEGNKTTHHDNELATFVVGLGNITLVNIMGENPSEMQDVLQIVVQAFMRMNKVRLSPSCVFVHQNVTDVSATEKNMDRKRKLLEKLDTMARLAAKEEGCDAESFSDIIEFDIQKDVKYFAQLWEGSPPMAPPNPGYSDSVQDLKSYILEKAKMSRGVTLSEFKTKVEDLWTALLNENFVFSFKNTLEIAVYRKLEVQFAPAICEQGFEMNLVQLRKESQKYNAIDQCGDYSEYVAQRHQRRSSCDGPLANFTEDQEQFKHLIKDVEELASVNIKRGDSSSYLSEISSNVLTSIVTFESQRKCDLRKEFKVDLILYVFDRTHRWSIRNNIHCYSTKYFDLPVKF